MFAEDCIDLKCIDLFQHAGRIPKRNYHVKTEHVSPLQALGDGQAVKTMVVGTNVRVIGHICVTIKQTMTTCQISLIGVNNLLLIAHLSEDYVGVRVNSYSKFGSRRSMNLFKTRVQQQFIIYT